MNFRALVSLSSRNLSNSIEIGLMSLIRTNNLKPQAIVPPRLKAKSKVSLQIKYFLGCHCTCYTLHCILCTVPTPRVLSLHLTYSSSYCFCFSCQLRPVSLGPSVAIIYQSQASVPIGCSLPPSPPSSFACHAPCLSAPPSHMRHRAECSLSLCRSIAVAIYGPAPRQTAA